ncbi:MAG: murein biosynthesis integral membrane protein MurJ [Planctomycetota bacterium]
MAGESGQGARERRQATLGRAGAISAATMSSRVLGLLREQIFARLFGAGLISDAFIIAYRIPNLLRDLFAEGALSAAFIPTFSAAREKQGEEEAFLLGRVVFTVFLAITGGLTLLGMIFAPAIVDAIAPGFSTGAEDGSEMGKRALTITLTRWMMPVLLFVTMAAISRGILNTYHRYFLPALSPAIFNLVAIVCGYALWALGASPGSAIRVWAAATLAGAALTFFVQAPPLRRIGFHFRALFTLRHPGLRRILRMMTPATLGLAAVQVNIFVNSILASHLEDGAVSWLNFSFRLVYLPIGVIGVALATVTAVDVSREAARENAEGFHDGLATSLRLVAFFTIPAAAGLIALAQPIVSLIYEYGEFDPEDTAATATALRCYAAALFFYSAVKVLAPSCYALDRARAPVIASVAAVSVNIAWSLSTYRSLGYAALAAGTALAAAVNFLLLIGLLRRGTGGIAGRGLAAIAFKMTLIAAPMGAACWGLEMGLAQSLGDADLLPRLMRVLLPILLGVILVLLGGRVLEVPETDAVKAIILRRGSSRV